MIFSAAAAAVDACGESRLTANDAAAAATLESKRQRTQRKAPKLKTRKTAFVNE